MKHPFEVVALVLLLTACGGESGPSFTQQTHTLGFTNNPDVDNPRILIDRVHGTAGFQIHDLDAGLFSLQASTTRQLGCATAQFYTWFEAQYVVHDPLDPGSALIQQLAGADGAFLAVYRGPFSTLPMPQGSAAFCAELMARKLGEGTANYRLTDNDYYAWIHDRANSNAFGLMAQGSITTSDGELLQYAGVSRCVWDGDDGSRTICVDRINLR